MSTTPEGQQLAARIRDARSWLFDDALPLWSTVGVDGEYGFVEHLTLYSQPATVGYKRLRVQARQMYVFSHAYLLGYEQGLPVAQSGWQFMRDNGWCASGGWVRCLDSRGEILDATLDLYDQSFALLAIAWWIRASGDDGARIWAHRTLDAIEERIASPSGIGSLSESGPDAAHLQNPHMHLLEAMLALYAVTGESRFKTQGDAMLDLFATKLFDRSSGTLAEYYDASWNRAAGDRGRIVQPGHHYEWVWLLQQAAILRPQWPEAIEALFMFAERYGSAPNTGLIFDEVLDDGSVHAASHRSWPNSEALKAHLARFESRGAIDVPRTVQILDNMFRYFLAAPVPGTWIDQLDARCAPTVDKIPASTLYHVFVAFAELLRLEPSLRAAGMTD